MTDPRLQKQMKDATRPIVRAFLFGTIVVGSLFLLLPQGVAQGPFTGAVSLPLGPIHHLQFGGSGATDDCAYAELHDPYAVGSAPHSNDLRLIACNGSTQYTFVLDQDTAEKGYPSGTGNTMPSIRLAYADVNANAYFDGGDHLYLTTSSGSTLAATSSPTSFSIRLTSTGAKVGGTWVVAGDPDLVSYGSFAASLDGSWAWTDDDGNTVLSPGDTTYLLPGHAAGYPKGASLPPSAVALKGPPPITPTPPPQHSIRDASVAVGPIHHLLMNGPAANDDCAYAEFHRNGALAEAPGRFDFRLVGCLGRGAFTFVEDHHTTEVQYPPGSGNTAPPVRLAYTDVNANSVYDTNDGLYLTTGTANQLPGTTSVASFTIRILSQYSSPRGTWALAGDADIVSYGSHAPSLTGSWAWVDADDNGALSNGDEVYLLPTTPSGYPAGSQLPAGSVLLYAPAQNHMDCYHADYGFYDCNNPPTNVVSPTPTPPSNTTTQPQLGTNERIGPYAVPLLGPAGTIAAVAAAGGAATFFRRRH